MGGNVRINTYRDQDPKYADRPWWFEVEATNPGRETVLHTDGMFGSEEEAQLRGAIWAQSDEGREMLRRGYRVPAGRV